jgi:hypothetical protein
MIALHMTVLVNVVGYTLTAAGTPGRALWLDLWQAVALAAGDLAFIPILGAAGAAVAALFGSYASGPAGVLLARRSRFNAETACHVKQTLLLLICAALAWWVHPSGALSGTAFRAALVLLFVAFSLLLSTITRDDLGVIFARLRPHAVERDDREQVLESTFAG